MSIFIIFLIFFSQSIFAQSLPATNFQATHDFINKMVKKHHFSKTELVSIFSQVNLIVAEKKPKSSVKKPKPKTMSWDEYRSLFITNSRIKNGVEFWKNNLEALKRAEKKI